MKKARKKRRAVQHDVFPWTGDVNGVRTFLRRFALRCPFLSYPDRKPKLRQNKGVLFVGGEKG